MSVSITDFGKLTTGQPVQLVTLKNDKIEVQLLTYAAIIHRTRNSDLLSDIFFS